ncbi:MAG: RdgB/HAM1 family non-canonical purine NTP pyrophosphatase [Bacteroidota bacterium]
MPPRSNLPYGERIVLATRNPGKVDELRALLAGLPVELVSAAEIGGAPEVEEDAPTLEGNAEKKAHTLRAYTGLPSLADDTGLEVDALGGAPGVHSARFAGPDADDAANRARLLRDLDRATDRSARFRTVLAFAGGGEVRFFEGVCSGAITESGRGEGGFGYDAVFQPEGETRTFAEMPPEAKNAISHRGRALARFAAFLRVRLSTPEV